MKLQNRYEIGERLAKVGFGETFMARDLGKPSKPRCVVKKLIPENGNSPEVYELVKERFKKEAELLEKLGKHENIPELFASMEDNGEFYIVQEFIDGLTVSRYVEKNGKQSEPFILNFLSKVLKTLRFVHNSKIVHRDVTPNNIIIRPSNDPVLIDFGIVKEVMKTIVSISGNESQSIVVGTPGFMPSEQAAGHPIYSSDLYSLGRTAIYLATKSLPQNLNTDPRTGKLLWEEHASGISEGLIAVLNKSVEAQPSRRYQSTSEMLEALSALPSNRGDRDSSLGGVSPTGATQVVSPGGEPTRPIQNPPIQNPTEESNYLLPVVISLGVMTAVSIGYITSRMTNKSEPTLEATSPPEPTLEATSPPEPTLEATSPPEPTQPPDNNDDREEVNARLATLGCALAEPYEYIDGKYTVTWNIAGSPYEGVVEMEGLTGVMHVSFYNGETQKAISQDLLLTNCTSTQGLTLLGFDPVDYGTDTPANYAPDNIIIKNVGGVLQVRNCDDQGVCAPVDMQLEDGQ